MGFEEEEWSAIGAYAGSQKHIYYSNHDGVPVLRQSAALSVARVSAIVVAKTSSVRTVDTYSTTGTRESFLLKSTDGQDRMAYVHSS